VLRRCDPVTFLNMGRLYGEFAPMEKRIDIHINLLRKEEFRTLECVTDIGKCVKTFYGSRMLRLTMTQDARSV